MRQIDCGFSFPIRLLVNFGQAESWCQTNMLFKIGFYLPGLWYNMFWPARSWSNVQYTYDYIYMYTKEIAPSWCDCDKAPKVEMAVGVCREVFSRDELYVKDPIQIKGLNLIQLSGWLKILRKTFQGLNWRGRLWQLPRVNSVKGEKVTPQGKLPIIYGLPSFSDVLTCILVCFFYQTHLLVYPCL